MMFLQLPTEVPHPGTNSPIDFNSTFDVIVYIIAPIVLIVMYFYLRKKSRNAENDDHSDKNPE